MQTTFLTRTHFFPYTTLFRSGGERERERERERIPSRLHIASAEPNVGVDLRNREIMT